MVESEPVKLELATPETRELLASLLDLYMQELSNIFSIQAGADGRFRYAKLPLYWAEPGRFPFFIYSGAQPAGFALATRGSPVTDDPEVFDVAEFFVRGAQRRVGVGRRAAFLLWNRLPGRWVVRVSEANAPGLSFWSTIVKQYTGGAFLQDKRFVGSHTWHVFTFASRGLGEAV